MQTDTPLPALYTANDEGEQIWKVKYMKGRPRQYRFDAKEGVFNIDGNEKLGRTLSFQPIAWRFFKAAILNMPAKQWVEFYFIDEQNALSCVMFHSYSVDNVFKIVEPLYYADQSLHQVVITATAERKENTKIQPKGVYYIATFSFDLADPVRTKDLQDYAKTVSIYRNDTITPMQTVRLALNYYDVEASTTLAVEYGDVYYLD